MKCREIIEKIQVRWPEQYALDWDNVGLLVGDREQEVHHILVALDVTDDVINKAISVGADMIVTHHPMIFSPMKKINSDDFIARRVMRLIKNDICYYAMHTNFDVMGMADLNAKALQLKNPSVLDVTYEQDEKREGIGRVGGLAQEMTLEAFAEFVKTAFGIEAVRVYGEPDRVVRKAAVCSGSGKSEVKAALLAGVDVYVTGDVDHHMGIDGAAQNLAIIDAGHYGTEMIFISYMEGELKEMFSQLAVTAVEIKQPFIMK